MKLSAGLLALILCGACSTPPAPTRITSLEQGGPRNARIIAQLTRQLCIDPASDTVRFERALRATGLPTKRVQSSEPGNASSLHIWSLPGADVIRGGASGEFWTCAIQVKAGFAPKRDSAIDALNALSGAKMTQDIGWQWRPSSSTSVTMTFDQTSEPKGGAWVFVEGYQVSLRTMLGV